MRLGFMPRGFFGTALVFAMIAGAPSVSLAGETWESLKPDVYGDRAIVDGTGVIAMSAPMRPKDQSNVPISADVELPSGRTIARVTFIVDENPSPVAADFTLGEGRSHISLGAKFRLNQATDVRVVVEASDGTLYMVSQHVKFAGGQAACAAPPNGDPDEIIARMGQMTFAHDAGASGGAAVSSMFRKAEVAVSHPNHTGMVLDQISLLYIPLRIVTDVEVSQGDERVFAMRGSMTLSQDPAISFDYRPNGAHDMRVSVRDSDAATWEKSFPIGPSS